MLPAATIVIPLLDQPDDWLEQSVLSACRQTVPCQPVVVYAACTKPSNLKLLRRIQREYPLLTAVAEPPGKYFAGALNEGFRNAAADRIGLLLADDWLEPDAVESCLPLSADIVSSGMSRYTEDGTTRLTDIDVNLTIRDFRWKPTLEQKAEYLGHFFLFMKSVLLKAGGADESLGDTAGAGVDDYDLIWSLLELGATVAIVERRLYNYRDHSKPRLTTRAVEDSVAALSRILDKHGVAGRERTRILERHGRWYGRPIHVVQREKCGVPL